MTGKKGPNKQQNDLINQTHMFTVQHGISTAAVVSLFGGPVQPERRGDGAMPTKVRQSSLGRLSTVCLAAAVCWVFLLPLGGRVGVLSFFMPEDFEDPNLLNALEKTQKKWCELPHKTRHKFIEANFDRVIRRFTSEVALSMEAAAKQPVSNESFRALKNAIRHALGPDVVVEPVGSRTRRTAAIQDTDLDLQIRRNSSSEQRDEPFTELDKQKVARNVQELNSVTSPVVIGNVAIKFQMEGRTDVDLVLWRPQSEEFPRLRGGKNFIENSVRINEILNQTPAARAAIIGVKSIQYDDRPKGLLLEAIAWRLSETCPSPLTKTASVFAGSGEETWKLQNECFRFFGYVMDHLAQWEASPFGDDLKADLALLSERKREEHIQRFAKFQEELEGVFFSLFVIDILRRAQEKWTKQNGPWHLYLERKLVEFLPFDEKRPSKKRKKAAPIGFGLPQAPRNRAEPRGFA